MSDDIFILIPKKSYIDRMISDDVFLLIPKESNVNRLKSVYNHATPMGSYNSFFMHHSYKHTIPSGLNIQKLLGGFEE